MAKIRGVIHDDPGSGHVNRLPWIASPVKVEELPEVGDDIDVDARLVPTFIKHKSSCFYELFFDLWFVASFEVFNELYTYIGYVCILWFTWASVGFYDVRFVTDSVFDRVTRLCHLGVMVGFSVVAPQFDPYEQHKDAFEATSFILAFSRLILAIQYLSVIWRIWDYKQGKIPIGINAAWHFILWISNNALIFFGIAFRFEEGKNSRVYVAWYIISAVEAIGTCAMSLCAQVLSFNGTHLTERMTTLTLIIVGERVISVATSVAHIVQNEGWTKPTIGILIADVIAIYVLFMVYFDWQDYEHLANTWQVVWTLVTFPFHASLLLFFTGAGQFVLWWKIYEVRVNISGMMSSNWQDWLETNRTGASSEGFATAVNSTVSSLLSLYLPPDDRITHQVPSLLGNISIIPAEFWSHQLDQQAYMNYLDQIRQSWLALQMVVVHSVYSNFDINLAAEDQSEDATFAIEKLEFQYSYATGGIMLILMVALYLFTKRTGWTVSFWVRASIFVLLGLGMSLFVLLSNNEQRLHDFLDHGAAVPVLAGIFTVVFLLTHVPTPSFMDITINMKNRRRKSLYQEYHPEPVVSHQNDAYKESQMPYPNYSGNAANLTGHPGDPDFCGSNTYSALPDGSVHGNQQLPQSRGQ